LSLFTLSTDEPTFLELPKGIPSHDTFGRVFAKIKPDEFQKRFIEWVQAIERLTAGQVIAVDGKKLRRSHDQSAGKAAIYMVSAWATKPTGLGANQSR
jgi:hypothetical protein